MKKLIEKMEVPLLMILILIFMSICWINLGGIGGFYLLNVGFFELEDEIGTLIPVVLWILCSFLMIGISYVLSFNCIMGIGDIIRRKQHAGLFDIPRYWSISIYILLCVLNFLIDVPWNIEGGLITIH